MEYVASSFLDSSKEKEMKKRYIIQNAISQKYWSGARANIWSSNILEARSFQSRQEVRDWIKNNNDELRGTVLVVIEVWV